MSHGTRLQARAAGNPPVGSSSASAPEPRAKGKPKGKAGAATAVPETKEAVKAVAVKVPPGGVLSAAESEFRFEENGLSVALSRAQLEEAGAGEPFNQWLKARSEYKSCEAAVKKAEELLAPKAAKNLDKVQKAKVTELAQNRKASMVALSVKIASLHKAVVDAYSHHRAAKASKAPSKKELAKRATQDEFDALMAIEQDAPVSETEDKQLAQALAAEEQDAQTEIERKAKHKLSAAAEESPGTGGKPKKEAVKKRKSGAPVIDLADESDDPIEDFSSDIEAEEQRRQRRDKLGRPAKAQKTAAAAVAALAGLFSAAAGGNDPEGKEATPSSDDDGSSGSDSEEKGGAAKPLVAVGSGGIISTKEVRKARTKKGSDMLVFVRSERAACEGHGLPTETVGRKLAFQRLAILRAMAVDVQRYLKPRSKRSARIRDYFDFLSQAYCTDIMSGDAAMATAHYTDAASQGGGRWSFEPSAWQIQRSLAISAGKARAAQKSNSSSPSKSDRKPKRDDKSSPTCNNYNKGSCKMEKCKYRHACSTCGEAHPVKDCTKGDKPATPSAASSSAAAASSAARSPFKAEAWARALRAHPDRERVAALIAGITNGVHIGFKGDRTKGRLYVRNHPSARDPALRAAITEDIEKEVKAGRTIALEPPLDPRLVFSPLAAVPKSDGGVRRIHDLSWPKSARSSINDGIEKASESDYQGFDAVAALVLQLGTSAGLCKLDVKSAFRCIPVHPDDRHLLGFSFGGRYYAELALPFGLRSSPLWFERYMTALEWYLHQRGITTFRRWVDDWLIGGRTRELCWQARQLIRATFEELGVPENATKLQLEGRPANSARHLGIVFDARERTASFDEQRLGEMRQLVQAAASSKRFKPRELQAIAGKLAFAAKITPSARTYTRRVFDAIREAKRTKAVWIDNSAGLREEWSWWQDALSIMPHSSLLLDEEWTEDSALQIFTDAAPTHGMGGLFGNSWFAIRWPHEVIFAATRASAASTGYLELYALATAAATWGQFWRGRRILFRCDNSSAVAAVNAGTSRDSHIMSLVRALHRTASQHGFAFRARHVPGVSNVAADALSRMVGLTQPPAVVAAFRAAFLKAVPKADPVGTEPVLPRPLL